MRSESPNPYALQRPLPLPEVSNSNHNHTKRMKRIFTIGVSILAVLASAVAQTDPLTASFQESLNKLPEAIAVAEFEVNKSYRFTGEVIQMTEAFILVKNPLTKQPLGILAFGDPKKVSNVAVDAGAMIRAIIRFKQFKNITMANRTSKRMAVFDCIGFMPVGGKYVDTSAPAASAAPAETPQK